MIYCIRESRGRDQPNFQFPRRKFYVENVSKSEDLSRSTLLEYSRLPINECNPPGHQSRSNRKRGPILTRSRKFFELRQRPLS